MIICSYPLEHICSHFICHLRIHKVCPFVLLLRYFTCRVSERAYLFLYLGGTTNISLLLAASSPRLRILYVTNLLHEISRLPIISLHFPIPSGKNGGAAYSCTNKSNFVKFLYQDVYESWMCSISLHSLSAPPLTLLPKNSIVYLLWHRQLR